MAWLSPTQKYAYRYHETAHNSVLAMLLPIRGLVQEDVPLRLLLYAQVPNLATASQVELG
eukprot:scaffold136168_cov32-Tisochrysis_lutea.AAC.2